VQQTATAVPANGNVWPVTAGAERGTLVRQISPQDIALGQREQSTHTHTPMSGETANALAIDTNAADMSKSRLAASG